MSNKDVRELLNKYMDRVGTTGTFIAKSIGVNRSTINLFKNGKRDLSDEKLNKILKIVQK